MLTNLVTVTMSQLCTDIITTVDTLNFYSIRCQLYPNKAGKANH